MCWIGIWARQNRDWYAKGIQSSSISQMPSASLRARDDTRMLADRYRGRPPGLIFGFSEQKRYRTLSTFSALSEQLLSSKIAPYPRWINSRVESPRVFFRLSIFCA